MKWGKRLVIRISSDFHTIEEGYQISFPYFGRGIRADSLPLTMTKASVFLSHIIKGYGDKPLPEPTAVSSIPNEEELVVLIQTELD